MCSSGDLSPFYQAARRFHGLGDDSWIGQSSRVFDRAHLLFRRTLKLV